MFDVVFLLVKGMVSCGMFFLRDMVIGIICCKMLGVKLICGER